MKLITESWQDLQYLYEAAEDGKKKKMFIEGIYLQSEIKNKNGRKYPKAIMDKEVKRYTKESIDQKNSFGELGHPTGPTINPERISHLIISLKEDGNDYIGKAQILETPMGEIARSIMESGGRLAVSSRGIGSLKKVGGVMEVCEDFQLSTAADIVINPSAPSAFVNGLYEGVEYLLQDGQLIERTAEEIKEELNKAIRSRQINEEKILEIWKKTTKLLSK